MEALMEFWECFRDRKRISFLHLMMTFERSKAIDYTHPFYETITVLYSKKIHSSGIRTMLEPFSMDVWLAIVISMLSLAVILSFEIQL